jgi:2-polyprenyl-6-hydroxyphenyl methylase / 3-demethylubiquinone-9 3-methyltransferase
MKDSRCDVSAAASRTGNVDPDEVARFAAQAALWWDTGGAFKALHEINPVRLAYTRERAGGLAGKSVLDVGCGGGLLAEAMAAEGARVTGIDMAADTLAAARHHAAAQGLPIDYRLGTAEEWARLRGGRYDAVTCMELVEHVPRPAQLVAACAALVRPGGDVFFATVNRTLPARILVIWLAEYVFGIVPRGTHTYGKFVRPGELARAGAGAGLAVCDLSGLRYLPWIGYAALCGSPLINYLMHLKRQPSL